MRAVDIITHKRDGAALSAEEIRWFIDAYTRGDLPDYQAAALLMAVVLRGMTPQETVELTLAMAESGQQLDLSDITPYAVDKHSSGGVGDKTSLVVLPLVASFGVTIAKMSGRGLGFTGGTLDKLESIPGYRADLSEAEFRQVARDTGIVLAGQSAELAPADGKLYALRDVTGTVQSLPLIVSSIMSKKIAAGAQGIVLDVKVGSGAFMKTVAEGRQLAQQMVDIGTRAGRDVIAVVSDMNQPLGHAVGNALEVVEAIETLNGGGPADLRAHCLEVAAHMLRLAGQGQRWTDSKAVQEELAQRLDSGQAFAQFRRLVGGQGGDLAYVDDPTRLPQAKQVVTLGAEQSGIISRVDAMGIARMALELGAGRAKKADALDHAVGVVAQVKVGDAVQLGDPLLTVHANSDAGLRYCEAQLTEAIHISPETVPPLPLFYDTIIGDSVPG